VPSVLKSDIYGHYRVAFKFVNRIILGHPTEYLYDGFPFGQEAHDLGRYENDFRYEDDPDQRSAQVVDYGSSYNAFRVRFRIDDRTEECIALTHESGIEVFLIAASAFVAVEVAKYSVKRVLEATEGAINRWFSKYKKRLPAAWDDKDEPLVKHITVRTPHWELALDNRFTAEEAEATIGYLQRYPMLMKDAAEYFSRMEDEALGAKISRLARRVVRIDISYLDTGS
jgi:hypothetical protein